MTSRIVKIGCFPDWGSFFRAKLDKKKGKNILRKIINPNCVLHFLCLTVIVCCSVPPNSASCISVMQIKKGCEALT